MDGCALGLHVLADNLSFYNIAKNVFREQIKTLSYNRGNPYEENENLFSHPLSPYRSGDFIFHNFYNWNKVNEREKSRNEIKMYLRRLLGWQHLMAPVSEKVNKNERGQIGRM